jgi:ferredoxin, 2Fe-2S
MAGTNPYITQASFTPATKPYKVTFKIEGQTVEVDVHPENVPFGRSGLPGSILDICEGNGIELEHSCGGVCACSTCHVIVKEGLDSCNEATEDEEDQLEEAPGLTIKSRLGCQCVPDGSQDLVIEIPEWNRNAVKEAPH